MHALGAIALLCALVAGAGGAQGAASTTVVTAEVVGSVSLGNSCTSRAATGLGTVLPNQAGLTATGAGQVCSLSFSSSSDTSMVRIAQRDGFGTAMGALGNGWADRGVGGWAPDINELQAYDASLWIGVTAAGGVVRSTNGGTTSTSTAVSTVALNGVDHAPADPNTWWIVGEERNIFRTTTAQAGTPTWTSQSAALGAATPQAWPSTVAINAVTVLSATTAVISGDSGWIAKTTNSGTNWTAFQHPGAATSELSDIDAVNTNDMFIAGTGDKLLRTTLGGDTIAEWTAITTGAGMSFTSVDAVSANRAYFTAGHYLARYDLGTVDYIGTGTGDATDVVSPPGLPDTVYVSSEYGTVIRSTDSGWTFTPRFTRSAENLKTISMPTATTIFVGGVQDSAESSTDAGVTWRTDRTTPVTSTLFGVDSDPVDGRKAIAVGAGGIVHTSSDMGVNWTSRSSGTTRGLLGVSWGDSTRAWAAGDGGTILRTDDSGATWAAQSSPTTTRFSSVVARDERTAVAVSPSGVIAYTRNGTSWNLATVPGTPLLRSVTVTPAGTFVAVGRDSAILRSTDDGATWTAVPGGSKPYLWSLLGTVTASPTGRLYTFEDWSTTWASDDDGLTWTYIGEANVSVRSAAAVDSVVEVAGRYGSARRSIDSGATFPDPGVAARPSGAALYGLELTDTHNAFIVGEQRSFTSRTPSALAGAQVSDFASPASDWDSAPTSNMFGVCLQAVGAGTTAAWSVDGANTPGKCEPLDSDPWRAVPVAPSKVAQAAAGVTGRVDVVWGFRPSAAQNPGVYRAGVVIEAVAPAV